MLALSLVACGGKKADVVEPEPDPTTAATDEPVVNDDEPTTEPEEPQDTDPTDEPSDADASDELVVGVLTDTQYTNKALGIAFTTPDGWRFATNEEIALSMQLGADIIMDDPEAFKEAIKDQPYFFDVMAFDSTGTNNFNINYTDLTATGVGTLISEASYAALVEYQFKEMESFKDAVFTQGSHQLADESFVTLTIDSTQTTVGMYQRQYLKKLGSNYLVVITISSLSMEMLDATAALFTNPN